jgi:tRNA (Thr-GGU) A37 N-methylase
MSEITCKPVAVVVGGRDEIRDDHGGEETSIIRLDKAFPLDALAGLEDFSHVEVVFHFDRVPEDEVEGCSRHPRGREDWPRVGIFSQRGKNRPNRLGVSRAEVLRVSMDVTSTSAVWMPSTEPPFSTSSRSCVGVLLSRPRACALRCVSRKPSTAGDLALSGEP